MHRPEGKRDLCLPLQAWFDVFVCDEQRVNGMRKPEEFRETVYPKLVDVSIRELTRRTGLSLAYCRQIRRGLVVPHPMWWEALARSVAISPE